MSRVVPVAPPEWVAAVATPGGVGGLGAGGGATVGSAVATAELGAAAALAAAGTAAEASRERRVRSVWQQPRFLGWVALLRQRRQVGEEPGCHGG